MFFDCRPYDDYIPIPAYTHTRNMDVCVSNHKIVFLYLLHVNVDIIFDSLSRFLPIILLGGAAWRRSRFRSLMFCLITWSPLLMISTVGKMRHVLSSNSNWKRYSIIPLSTSMGVIKMFVVFLFGSPELTLFYITRIVQIIFPIPPFRRSSFISFMTVTSPSPLCIPMTLATLFQ